MNFWTRIGIYGLIAVGFLTSLNVAYRRHNFEENNKTVEIALAFSDVKKLSEISGLKVDSLLKRLKQEGHVTSIVLEEKTLADLENNGEVTVLKGSEVINLYRVGYTTRHILKYVYQKVKVVPEDFYLNFNENAVYEFVSQALNFELGKSAVSKIYKDEVLRVSYEKDRLLSMGLGFYESDLKRLSDQGFSIIPSISHNNLNNSDVLRNKFSTLKDVKMVRSVTFSGNRVFGYPDNIGYLQSKINESDLNVVKPEFMKQDGFYELVKNNMNKVLTMHTLDKPNKPFVSVDVMVNRFVRAAKERRVNVLLLKPILEESLSASPLEKNLVIFDNVYTELKKSGFDVGPIKSVDYQGYESIKIWELLLVSLSIFSFVILTYSYFFPVIPVYLAMSYLAFAGLFALSFVLDKTAIYNRVSVLLVAITLPIYALIAFFPKPSARKRSNVHLYSFLYMAKIVGITLVGCFLVVAVMSDISYLSSITQFFGVKLSFMIPLFLICLFFFLRPHRLKSIFYVFHRLSYVPVRTGALITVMFCILFIALYLLRSGNYISLHIPIFEFKMREGLEQIFFIRPRTKEFLIGYPFLLFAFVFVDRRLSRNWVWFFNGLGSVALISVINSFCHIHTPILISLIRTGTGLALGLLIGYFYILIFSTCYSLFKRYFL